MSLVVVHAWMQAKTGKAMLFSSHIFIFIFFPVVLAGYFLLNRPRRPWLPRLWLVLASLFFYGWFNPAYLSLIVLSILVNYFCGIWMITAGGRRRRQLVAGVGLVFNLGLIGYYKYYDFFVENLNALAGTDWAVHRLLLPLGISFFTFQQISFLMDCYRREAPPHYSFLNYSLFVLFSRNLSPARSYCTTKSCRSSTGKPGPSRTLAISPPA